MSEVHTITANKRDRAGKGAARATRREGHVPGVIYGNKQSPVLIALDPREIDREIQKKGFYTTLFDLKVGSDAHRVLARDIQFDPVTDRVVHADFMRVTDATRVRVHVPVAFANEGLSPGIKRGGVLNVASMEGFMPVPYQATYAAAKAFMLSLSRALAYETMYTGVRISALAPGTTATGLHAKAGAENSRYVMLLPVMTSEDLARIAYRQFMRGKKVIVAGWFNRLSVVAQRFAPDFALVPLMGWLFRVRDEEGNLQLPRALSTPKAGNGRVPADAASGDGPSLSA